jgi:hypothetical protein
MAGRKKQPTFAPAPTKRPKTAPRTYVQANVSPEQLLRIKQLALDERCTVTDLVLDGLELLFKRRKLPPLFPPQD